MNIISTLSDKDATQVKFNELLEEYRTQILQEKLGNAWNDMSELEQLSISKLNNFFVDYMLSLVHAVEAASSCFIELEKGAFESIPPIHEPTFRKTSE